MTESTSSSTFWIKISSATVACFSLLLFESYVFTSLPHTTKYKIYRFQFGVVLNIVFYAGSKFIWRRLVHDVLKPSTPSYLQHVWKGFVLLFIVLAHVSPFTNYLSGRDPLLFSMVAWTCFGSYIGLFFLLHSLNVMMKCLKRVSTKLYVSSRKQSLFSVIFTTACTWIALIVANSAPVIINVEVPIANLPHSMDNMRIALICDVHLGPTVGFSKLDRVVKMVNSLNPDIVAFAGDLIDVTVEDADGAGLPLKDLKAPYGKYFATGNHEYYSGDVSSWFKLLEDYGFTILHNENRKIYSKSNKNDWFCMIGTDDLQANQISYEDHGMNLSQAYSGCDPDHASILIAHQPKAAKLALDSEFNIQLVLSGHTHGGQIYPIIWIAYLVNPFLHGLYHYTDDRYVYVSQGSVYYGFPLRLGSYPEITNITLRAKL